MKEKSIQTFNEKYDKVINEMKKYLFKNKLKMISFTNCDGWNFKLNISQKNYDNLKELSSK